MPPEQEFASTGGVDPAAFAASMFPSEPSSGAAAPSEGVKEGVSPSAITPPAAASTTPAAAAPPVDSGITQAAWDALPKAWKKDMEAQWKGLNPDVRKYVHEREQQAATGISSYKAGSEKWNQATAPFAAIMAQYPDANPVDILSTIAQNHVMMLQASPEERVHHALALARGYGVELTRKEAREVAAATIEGQTPPAAQAEDFSPGQIAALQRMLAPVLSPLQAAAAHTQKQVAAGLEAEVDKFFSDPKNEFAGELGTDILAILKTGQTQNLSEAYELALLRNPEVKARYLTKLAKDFAPAPSNVSKLPNVKSSATPISASKPGTIDETIAGVISKHYGT